MNGYIPKQGDILYLSFSPQRGHEQRGRRPGLVISRDLFNERVGLAYVCPITSRPRNYPFRLPLPEGLQTHGFVMVDQCRALDYQAREARWIEQVPAPFLQEVLEVFYLIFFG